jgi:TonB-linked SusC/RagA family outer membrane protein
MLTKQLQEFDLAQAILKALSGRLLYTLVFGLAFGAILQAQTVRGTVTDQSGDPVVGATVSVKNTTTATYTDADGNYSINANGNATLVFEYLGFKTLEIGVNGRTTVDAILSEDQKLLDEVIITAFGLEQDRRTLVSAAQSVNNSELMRAKEANLVDALNSKVAGVMVTRQGGAAGAGSNILIRGNSSISGENQPLFVVDGIPINNSFRSTSRSSGVDVANRALDINPADIESITVLKGPAATALYGLQAGSGAVIITTKKGSRSDVKKVSVDYSVNYSTDRVMRYFPGQLRYAQGDNGLYGNLTFSHFGPPLTTLRYDGTDLNPQDPRGRIVDMNDPSAIASATLTPVNNQELFYQNGQTLENNLTITSGNRHGSVILSVGNTRQEGIIPNNTFNRTNVKLTGETSVTDNLRLIASANYINTQSVKFGRGDNFSDVIQGTIRTPPSFDNSAGFVLANGHQRSFRYNPANPNANGPDNPFWVINNNPFQDDVNRLIGYAQAIYDPLPWLNIMYRIGTDFSNDKRNQQWAVGSRGGDGILGRVQEDTWNDKIINSDFIVTARKKWNDFNTSFLVGHNYFSSETRRQYFDGRNLAIPGLYNISNAQDNLVQIQNTFRKKTAAAFSRINLDYKSIVFMEVTGRNEWTSTLLAPNNSFFYGSIGGGIIFTELFGGISNDILSFGKIRSSFAQAGRDAPAYTNTTFYNRGSVSGTWGGGIVFPLAGSGVGGVELSNVAGNPTLRPERNNTFEIGAELGLFKDRIFVDFTYYRAVNVDQILAVTVPGSTGFNNQFINSGEIENKGIELVIEGAVFSKGDFQWNIGANFTRNRSLVLSLPVDRILIGGWGNLRPQVTEGEPYSVFYGTAFKRNEAGQLLLDNNGYPQLDASGDKRIGDPNPDWMLGLRNTFQYKNVTLSFLWDFRMGGDVAHISTNWMLPQGVGNNTLDRGHLVIFNGVKESDGTINTTPALIDQTYFTTNAGGRNIAERFIEDGSWVRLRDLNIGIMLPAKYAQAIRASRLDVSFYGRNLLLFTPYSGIDPETNLYGPNASMGIDAFGTPNTRSFGINLNVSF